MTPDDVDRFGPDELEIVESVRFEVSADRSLSALDLLTAWALHVERIRREPTMPVPEDRARKIASGAWS